MFCFFFFFFKQKTAYEMRISDWSSDVCSSDLEAIIMVGEIGGSFLVAAANFADHDNGFCFGIVFKHFKALNKIQALDRVTAYEIGRASCRERVCQYV